MSSNKVIIFSAPSGSGKTTLVKHCLSRLPQLEFSITATTRKPRSNEEDGVDYYFLSPEEFNTYIAEDKFLEYEEVYTNLFYGTLKSEVERIWNKGKTVIFDVDVRGGEHLKQIFKDKALSVFIAPPSIEVLEKRLHQRKTDDPEMINTRVAKAEEELTHAANFDEVVVNDVLENAQNRVCKLIAKFIEV